MPGTGKTQLAMQLCVDTRLPNNYGGVEGCAVVVDAEGSWSCAAGGDRLWSMAVALVDHVKRIASRKAEGARKKERAGVNVSEQDISWLTPEFILSGIFVFRVHDEASQTCTLYNLPNFLLEQEKKGIPVKLIVVDSLAFHYRVASLSSFTDVNGSSNKSTSLSTTHNLTRMAAFLTEVACEFDLAVVAINHLTTRIERDSRDNKWTGTKMMPALGESWAHSITTRLMVDHYRHFHKTGESHSSSAQGMDEIRTCTLVKSPHKPNGTALFTITDKGVRGPDLPQPQKRPRLI